MPEGRQNHMGKAQKWVRPGQIIYSGWKAEGISGGLRDEARGVRRPNYEGSRHLEFTSGLMRSPGKVRVREGA